MTQADPGPIVSSSGVEEFGKSQHDEYYFLFWKILFRNMNAENEAKQNLLGLLASLEDKDSLWGRGMDLCLLL